MRHDKDSNKAKPNTGIKVTQWNYACVRSTWIHNRNTQKWTKIGDREPIDTCEDVDEEVDHCVILIHTENYVYPKGFMAQFEIDENTPIVTANSAMRRRSSICTQC